MKKLIIYLSFAIIAIAGHHTAAAQAQQIPSSLVTLSTLTDLRAMASNQPSVVQILGTSAVNDGNNGYYYWNATSTATDDGFATIAVTGITTGRWIRLFTGNTLRLSISITPILLTTAYAVSYGVTLPVIPANIQVQSTSANGSLFNFVTNKTTTGFTLNFASVPVGVCTFDIFVIKM